MKSFHEMGLPEGVVERLDELNFLVPTPIQAQTIPLTLEGKDVLGLAQTGTGKTMAFGLPLIVWLKKHKKGKGMVLAPTRELAQQVGKALQEILGEKSGIKMGLLIGGDSMGKQIKQLESGARLIVGTPGRVIDHLERETLEAGDVGFLVLDEADRMFDMGFGVQLEEIISRMPGEEERQTLMFSATLPKNVERLAREHLNNPERISVGSITAPVEMIKQEVVHVTEDEKYEKLVEELEKREGSVIIFVKTRIGTEKLAKVLSGDGFEAVAIHGELRQNKREKVISGFRKGKFRILVATDVAARGLDIPHIQHVVNYDLPQSPEDYIHRIGRTARAGAEGFALCLISPRDKKLWRAVCDFMKGVEGGEGGEEERPRRGRGGFGGARGKRGFGGKRQGGGKRAFGGKKEGGRKFGFGEKRGEGDERPKRAGKDREEGGERGEAGEARRGGKRFGEERGFGGRKKEGEARGFGGFRGRKKEGEERGGFGGWRKKEGEERGGFGGFRGRKKEGEEGGYGRGERSRGGKEGERSERVERKKPSFFDREKPKSRPARDDREVRTFKGVKRKKQD